MKPCIRCPARTLRRCVDGAADLLCHNGHALFVWVRGAAGLPGCHTSSGTPVVSASQLNQHGWPRGVTASTLDSESSDRGSNPREACCDWGILRQAVHRCQARTLKHSVDVAADLCVTRGMKCLWGSGVKLRCWGVTCREAHKPSLRLSSSNRDGLVV